MLAAEKASVDTAALQVDAAMQRSCALAAEDVPDPGHELRLLAVHEFHVNGCATRREFVTTQRSRTVIDFRSEMHEYLVEDSDALRENVTMQRSRAVIDRWASHPWASYPTCYGGSGLRRAVVDEPSVRSSSAAVIFPSLIS